MIWTNQSVEVALCQRGWFSEQSREFRGLVLDAATWREYGHGDIVLSEHDSDHALYAVVAGLVRYSHLTATGEDYLDKVFKPGDWFNLIALLDGAPLPFTASVSGAACVLTLSQAAFESLVSAKPQFYRNFARVLCQNLRETAQRVLDINSLSPEQRLAKLLLDIESIEHSLNPLGKTDLRITQTDLCQLLVLSRATVNGILKTWHEAGWVDSGYAKVSILDQQQLNALALGR